MKLSISVRIAEGFLSKEEAILTLEQVTQIVKQANYDAVCMRASQVGVHSSADQIESARNTLQANDCPVSMVTGNFDIVYNNANGPDCLRNITPFVDLACKLSAPMIRVALKQEEDIEWAKRAASEAAERNVQVVHQCHTLSLFETVDQIEDTLKKIDHPNFGLIFEPANLEICGQDYGSETIERLAPWIFNVYLQNQKLDPDGSITLDTWCRGPVSFDLIQIHDPGGVHYDLVFDGLRKIGYEGTVTVHQSGVDGASPEQPAAATSQFLRDRMSI